jgi:hypothetical protein
MKRLYAILSVILVSGMLMSCSTTTPLTATSNPVGDKKGTSSTTCFFSLLTSVTYESQQELQPNTLRGQRGTPTSWGVCFGLKDYGIHEAATNGNIDKVATVDLRQTNYLLWRQYELVVGGK